MAKCLCEFSERSSGKITAVTCQDLHIIFTPSSSCPKYECPDECPDYECPDIIMHSGHLCISV